MNAAPSGQPSDMTTLLCEILKRQCAPEVELDTFEGDPLEFRYFMSSFEEVVENKVTDPKGRLTRLIQYKGEAKDLIKPCIQQPQIVVIIMQSSY